MFIIVKLFFLISKIYYLIHLFLAVYRAGAHEVRWVSRWRSSSSFWSNSSKSKRCVSLQDTSALPRSFWRSTFNEETNRKSLQVIICCIIDFSVIRAYPECTLILMYCDEEWENRALFGAVYAQQLNRYPATVKFKIVLCLVHQ